MGKAPGPVSAWVGLGSNLDRPRQQLERAFVGLARLPGTRLVARSPLYHSPPMGPPDQPDYVNAVAMLETGLDPHRLLAALQEIETAHGRRRERRWGPRTLDLDLLLYGDRVIRTPELTVPHPGLTRRAFVLYPLRDLAPDLMVPGAGPVRGLADACADPAVVPLRESGSDGGKEPTRL
ncbi:MAG TPA: 2-amino-4-hydroxy-6-hydroxymethyldihydropteridine diphosphokinase [Sedimenticola thiotaurini]|uniref:2-amino-4-hydroxy-6-hydroxymethyldihydropteridine pyrophosphokinase n=1 Tax=Sedimenticola thiotaurini TaxID=1543721 RepID=A0A831RLW7_9GAMM|nr:2-amino-4-hydroxy-6-hydroxymethyldihydropteridine diphosphokinase [Sedimenticola thiotaurini]